ncbi:MAG: hypothetical protein ACRC2T_03315 [Thermoguttaceae bacterium]
MTCEELIAKYKHVATAWNELKTDRERWEFLLKHKSEYSLLLDNDSTTVSVSIPEEELQNIDFDDIADDLECESFEDWVGWDNGVVLLFEVLGIDASPC